MHFGTILAHVCDILGGEGTQGVSKQLQSCLGEILRPIFSSSAWAHVLVAREALGSEQDPHPSVRRGRGGGGVCSSTPPSPPANAVVFALNKRLMTI